MKDKRKTINQVLVKDEVYDWVIKEANLVGEDVRYHVGDMLELWFMSRDDIKRDMKENPAARLLKLRNDFRRQTRMKKMVYQMAAIYVEFPNEGNADKLQQACDDANVDYDEIIQVAARDPFSSIIATSNSQTKLDECVLWLTDQFKKDSRIPSRKIYARGKRRGFGERMITRGKNSICDNEKTPYIKSVKTGKNWEWILIEGDIDEGNVFKSLPPIEKPKPIYFIDPYSDSGEIVIVDSSEEKKK